MPIGIQDAFAAKNAMVNWLTQDLLNARVELCVTRVTHVLKQERWENIFAISASMNFSITYNNAFEHINDG